MSEILLLCEGGERLKRLLCLVLVLLVLPWGGVVAEEGGAKKAVSVENWLLDIPLGINLEECRELIKEHSGLELIEGRRYSMFYFSSPNDELRMGDYPVELEVEFYDDDSEMLWALIVRFECYVPQEKWEEFAEKRLHSMLKMIEGAEQNYGEALGGIIGVESDNPQNGGNYTLYILPIADGMLDEALLSNVHAESGSFGFLVYYDGAYIDMGLARYEEGNGEFFAKFDVFVQPFSLERAPMMLCHRPDVLANGVYPPQEIEEVIER